MAIPTIVTLYQWLRSKSDMSFPMLSDGVFAPEVIDQASTQSTTNKDIVIRVTRLKAAKQMPKDEDLKLAWFDNPEDYAGLSDFIGFIQAKPSEEHHYPLQVTLDYLLLHPETAANPLEAFTTLFVAWMASNPVDAIAWYEEEATQEKLLSTYQETHLGLGRVLVEHYLQEARTLFNSVSSPMGLTSLFAEYYDNPQRTAAFILWLLESEATSLMQKDRADKIIQSGLLHEFFLAHAGFMESRDNPVTQLYGLLGTFEQAKPMVERAHLISVMTQAELRGAQSAEREGQVSNKKYFKSYALDGTDKHTGLEIIETRPVAFDAVPQPDHFKTFYRLFGQRFLLNLLNYYDLLKSLDEYCTTSQYANMRHVLEPQFNYLAADGVSPQELMQLLNRLAGKDQGYLLEAVADLLQETTINALIKSDNFAVFHLIPYKPLLRDKLDLKQVQRYIASIKPGDDPFDQLILLRTMLLQLVGRYDVKKTTTDLLFDKIINVLMTNPNRNDGRLIQDLKSVASHYEALLQQHAVALTEQLGQLIQGVLTSEAGLTPDTSKGLHDAWVDLSRKRSVLKEIWPNLTGDFPHDKCAFYVSVVKAAVRAHEKAQSELKAISSDYQIVPLNLQATLSNFFPVVEEQEQLQNYPENSVSEHERTLIECLASIDNETLWAQAIQLLEASPINRLDWTARDYGGHTIAELAAKQGNNPFIQYLLKENKLSQAAVNHLLKTAFTASQWDIVKRLIHLTGDNKPGIEFVSEALVAATKAGQLEHLLRANDTPAPGFFPTQPNRIRLPVEPASLTALTAVHGEEETVKLLIKLSPELLHTLVTRTHVTDYSGRTFTNISSFQYSLWAMDWHMWDMMLDSLQEAFNEGYTEAEAIREEMLRQYKEVVDTHGVDYTLNGEVIRGERHFDLKPLIDALGTYVKKFDGWSKEQREKHWCHVVGQLQRLVPAHVAQHYCEGESFNGNKPFRGANFSRSLQFNNFCSRSSESWFPLSQENRLGFDFAIYHCCGRLCGGAGRACGLPRSGHGQDAFDNLAALSVLYKEGTNNIAALRERLAIPLQKRDLGASYGVP